VELHFLKYDIGKHKKLKVQHILAKNLAKILRYLTVIRPHLMRGNQLPVSAARWQHGSKI
jgi:hypothetical protein